MGRCRANYRGGGEDKVTTVIGYGSMILVGKGARLSIGSPINREVKIICTKEIFIGEGGTIAMGTVIRDNDGGTHKIIAEGYENAKPVHIGNHVWIGENCMILKGVTIGDGAVIAASSLVIRDIPPRCLVGGHPAKVLRKDIEWEL